MRSIWSGALSFGLIYIPVKVYNATKSHQIDFDMLRRSITVVSAMPGSAEKQVRRYLLTR